MKNRILSLFLSLALIILLMPSYQTVSAGTTSTVYMTVGESKLVSYSTSQSIVSVQWTSSRSNDVQITNSNYTSATIKAVNSFSGYAIVRCTFYYLVESGSFPYQVSDYADFNVYVSGINPTSVSMSQTTATLAPNETLSLKATIQPSNATETSLTWSSNNTSTATVSSSGTVTAVNIGTAIITVKTSNNLTATCAVTVENPNVATPTANPKGGAVEYGRTVTLSTTTSGASIRYTTDGSTPASSSTLYTGAITIDKAMIIKAIGIKSGSNNSPVMTESYTIARVSTPVANPTEGAVELGRTVTLSTTTSGAAIYYTIDGSTPTANSTLYIEPITINKEVTIKAIGVRSGAPDSSVMTANYTISAVAPPVANPAGGIVEAGHIIILSTVTSEAQIYYTTDGSMPTTSSTLYTGAITIDKTMTINAIGVKDGAPDSSVMTQAYYVISEQSPKVNGGFPANNQTELSVIHLITVEFDKDIQQGPEFGSISLKQDSTTFTGEIYIGGNILYFIPAADLKLEKNYVFIVPAGAVSDSDSYINTEYIKEFSTATVLFGDNLKWATVSAGTNHTVAIAKDGSLWAWGSNAYGQLGNGTTNSNVPVQIPGEWVAVSAGGYHTTAMKSDGSLWAWGWNNYGQLGNGTTINSNVPIQIAGEWISASSGYFHTMAIKTDGSLWSWGSNEDGQLGDSTTTNSRSPKQIKDEGSKWSSVSSGGYHTTAIKTDGSLWAWGNNEDGQLGDGTITNSHTPKLVDEGEWLSVSSGGYHTTAIKTDGSLWAWGWNNAGQLGLDNTTDSSTPVQVQDDYDWAVVSAGREHTTAMKSNGSLWIWGSNSNGRLGDGTTTNKSTPIQNSGEWTFISAGLGHTTAIKFDGSLWAWGTNANGQLGNGTITNSSDPVNINAAKPLPADKIILDKSELILNEGGNGAVFASLQSAGSSANIKWSSSNPSVATVNRGMITAVCIGTATITASIPNPTGDEAITATCVVTVGETVIYNLEVLGNVFARAVAKFLIGTIIILKDETPVPITDTSKLDGLSLIVNHLLPEGITDDVNILFEAILDFLK